jgi:putative ABC transport system permease protein
MLFKSIKYSYHALKRQKVYLLINIIGLSFGIVCSLIIALYIIHELSFDQFNEKKDRIYRLIESGASAGDQKEKGGAATCAPAGPALLKEFPEVEDYTRLNIVPGTTIVKYFDKSFTEDSFIEADSSFFNIFSVPLLLGDKKSVLSQPHYLVLSESTARKILGEEDPIGKMIKIGEDTVFYIVSGIMADVPENSHFKANMIGSFMTNTFENQNDWSRSSLNNYLLLKPNTDPAQINAKMPEFYIKYKGPVVQRFLGISIEEYFAKGNKLRYYLQPLSDIHLNPSIQQWFTKPATDPKNLFIFGTIGILILIIASINFINLSTAQASRRAKEVGIKKVCGSTRGMLISQFLTESVLLSVISLALALVIIEYSIPYLNNLLRTNLQLNLFTNWFTLPILILFSLIVGLLSGSYPAFFLSSIIPSIVLKGRLMERMKNGILRNILVILQLSISIILISSTILMVKQIRFMLNKDLGFNKEQLLVITRAGAIGNQINPFKDAISKIPDVINVSSSTAVPGHSEGGRSYKVEGQNENMFNLRENFIDYDFFDTYGIKLSSGRAFNESFVTDRDACIINESAVKQLNLTHPLTAKLINDPDKLHIVGVVKNFNFESLRDKINIYSFRFKNKDINFGYISIRLSPKATANTIKSIEKVWKEFSSNDPFQYFFMDQELAQMYMEEKQKSQMSVLFSILAVLIAVLGLFGLTSFTMKQRTKEIGIRKIYGSNVARLLINLNVYFLKLIAIAFVIATPIVVYLTHRWIQNFAYQTEISWWIFALAGLIITGIVLLTVSYQSWSAATRNPVEALRYE